MPYRVLVAENAVRQRKPIAEALEGAGFEVVAHSRFAKARAALNDAAQEFDAAVIEESIGEGKGLQLLRETRSKRGQLPVVMLTRDSNWRSYADALGLGALAYLPEPFDPARLIGALAEALKSTCLQNSETGKLEFNPHPTRSPPLRM